ncbi:hypothetical protein FQN50_001638 [Emmonsiellopsis sp. PD_5]|nr:hypothetical protein FQN50_001638 [Emmonsiellopsis sp. PD_5]
MGAVMFLSLIWVVFGNQRRITFLGLPTDVLEELFDHFRPGEIYIPQEADKDNYATWIWDDTRYLLQLSSTCKQLRQLLIPRCFKIVYLKNTKESAAAVQRIVERELAAYVKEVRFHALSRYYLLNHGKYAYIKENFPNLDPYHEDAHKKEYPNAPESDFPKEVEEVLSKLSTLFPALETIRVEFVYKKPDTCPKYFKPTAAIERDEVAGLARQTCLTISSNTFEKDQLCSIHVTNRNHNMGATEWHFNCIYKLFLGRIATMEHERGSKPGDSKASLSIVAFNSDKLVIIEVQCLPSRRYYAESDISRYNLPVKLPLVYY